MQRKNTGFTLVELMMVVIILAILTAIAYPSYNDHVQRARRTDAQTSLMNVAALLEHYYTENNTYVGATLPVIGIGTITPEGFYTLSIPTLTATTYTVQANPVGGGPQASDPCGNLTLTHTSIKGPDPDTCWR